MLAEVGGEMLDNRTREVLCAIVKSYIDRSEPIGSRFVVKRYSLGFSPATIRNIMSDLEDLGFLNQPHASAGRVPTDKGYRFYVDSLFGKGISSSLTTDYEDDKDLLFQRDKVLADLIYQLANRVEGIKDDINKMFLDITNTLSVMSNYISVAIPPSLEKTTFSKISLIKYKGDSIVALLITEGGGVKNKILKINSGLRQDDLNRIADYLNSEYSGYAFDEIRVMLAKRMKQEKAIWDGLVVKALKICEQIISFTGEDIFISNLYDLIDLPYFSDISRIKEIAKAIRDKHLILQLLEEFSDADCIQVVIGNENPVEELKNLSIVASTYKDRNRPIGVIALIGPTRMNYSKAIYMVGTVAKCVSRAFN